MSTSTSISELAGFATDGLLDERLRVLAPVAVADYTFVSYVRSGLGAAIVAELHEDDPLTTTIDVSLTLWANAGPNGTQLASHSAVVYGPGDVIGFDAAQVINSAEVLVLTHRNSFQSIFHLSFEIYHLLFGCLASRLKSCGKNSTQLCILLDNVSY